MNKNTKWLIVGGLVLTGGFLMYANYTENKRREEYARLLSAFNQKNGYAEPPRNSAAWEEWVKLAIGTYGYAKTLWEPGGIFYKSNVPPVTDVKFWTRLNWIP
ncbi:MAG: hypothetical protein IPG12_14100 [Saprospiraceae bacterium]|nr:hypothetical protein [Saprospiraceae bacterium]